MTAAAVNTLDRGAALRIALAARAMPEVGVGRLLEVLHRRIDGPITEDSLKTVTVTDIKTGFASADGEEDGEDIGIGLPEMKEAVRILWGEGGEIVLPPLEPPFPEGAKVIRVAVASNNGEHLDGHFGSCVRFLVYQLGTDGARLVDIRSALEADLSDDRNAWRAKSIADCDVLFVQSIGGPAAAKVVREGIYPIKVKEAVTAREELERLRAVMVSAPPPWLAKLMGAGEAERVRFRHDSETA